MYFSIYEAVISTIYFFFVDLRNYIAIYQHLDHIY